MDGYRILAINPGSTSTKIAVFHNTNSVFVKNITHSSDELSKFEHISDQFEYRKDIIYKELQQANINLNEIKAVVGRGGLVKPIPSGVYEVNEALRSDLINPPMGGEHASNLGGLIALEIAHALPNAKAYITDPVVVDEMNDIARVAGHPDFKRVSIFHALNQKAIARQHAKSIMRNYEDLNLVVAHLGGGISVGAHEKGRVIDVNQALDGEGPFSPERSGTLPSADLVKMCFSGKYTQAELLKMICGKGGLVAHLGTNSASSVEERAFSGDEQAKFIFEAMAYQVAKAIGAMVAVLSGNVDAIILTGGIAYSKYFTNYISERVHKFAPLHVYPGEDEMRALAVNGLMVLKGEVQPKIYQ